MKKMLILVLSLSSIVSTYAIIDQGQVGNIISGCQSKAKTEKQRMICGKLLQFMQDADRLITAWQKEWISEEEAITISENIRDLQSKAEELKVSTTQEGISEEKAGDTPAQQ